MAPTYKRSDRVGERIQREISELLLKKVNDPRIGFVTITGVKVGDDLRNATVYVSVFGDEKKKSETMQGLNSALPFFQKEVFKRLQIKVSTQLYFKLDESLEKGRKIEGLLRQLREERASEAQAEGKNGTAS
jgi:ribosome-binding factor A